MSRTLQEIHLPLMRELITTRPTLARRKSLINRLVRLKTETSIYANGQADKVARSTQQYSQPLVMSIHNNFIKSNKKPDGSMSS